MYDIIITSSFSGRKERLDTFPDVISYCVAALVGGFMLTQKYLKEILHYCPDTGIFTWINSPSPRSRKGEIAGTTHYTDKYLHIKINGKHYFSHRLAWLYVHGEFPRDCIDHLNGIRTDNRLENIRSVTRRENSKNLGLSKSNTSGIMGVVKSGDKWIARIRDNYKTIHLGTFGNIFDAACARKSAERKYGYHPNHGKRVSHTNSIK